MTRIASVILCSCMLLAAGLVVKPASAGHESERYEVIVRPKPHHVKKHVWYSSICCYRKIVRHVDGERQVRYVRVGVDGHRPSIGTHESYRPGPHGPHHHIIDREPPRREAADDERDRPHHRYADDDLVHRRKSCHHRRVRVLTPGGGTAWAVEAGCD